MKKSRLFGIVWGVVLIFGITLTQQPAAKAASTVVFGPPVMGTTVTLGETSIDGPAIAGFTAGFLKSVIAWTGTDAQHHVNYMTSNDGLHYINKHGIVAWTETDAHHLLHVAVVYVNS